MYWLFNALLALLPSSVQAIEAPQDLSDPVALFENVCMNDKVRLKAKDFERVSFSGLPRNARRAFDFALPPEGKIMVPAHIYRDRDVPNTILARKPEKNIFLLLPDHDLPSIEVARQCAVIWRGSDFVKADRFANTVVTIPQPDPPPGSRALRYVVRRNAGTVIGAAELNNWTILRIAPDVTDSEEKPTR